MSYTSRTVLNYLQLDLQISAVRSIELRSHLCDSHTNTELQVSFSNIVTLEIKINVNNICSVNNKIKSKRA